MTPPEIILGAFALTMVLLAFGMLWYDVHRHE